MATIQWFPGHMSKARRQVQENISLLILTILVDVRDFLYPVRTYVDQVSGDKPVVDFNKADG